MRGWTDALQAILPHDPQGKKSIKHMHSLVNCKTSDGSTPLMYAIEQGCTSAVKLLLQKGASPSAEDIVRNLINQITEQIISFLHFFNLSLNLLISYH